MQVYNYTILIEAKVTPFPLFRRLQHLHVGCTLAARRIKPNVHDNPTGRSLGSAAHRNAKEPFRPLHPLQLEPVILDTRQRTKNKNVGRPWHKNRSALTEEDRKTDRTVRLVTRNAVADDNASHRGRRYPDALPAHKTRPKTSPATRAQLSVTFPRKRSTYSGTGRP